MNEFFVLFFRFVRSLYRILFQGSRCISFQGWIFEASYRKILLQYFPRIFGYLSTFMVFRICFFLWLETVIPVQVECQQLVLDISLYSLDADSALHEPPGEGPEGAIKPEVFPARCDS